MAQFSDEKDSEGLYSLCDCLVLEVLWAGGVAQW
jgi:hypothetical protein